MTDWSRRKILSVLAAGLPLSALDRPAHATELPAMKPPVHPFRIRTITAGLQMQGPDDLSAIARALARLLSSRKRLQDAGYEVQTLRVATRPMLADMEGAVRGKLWPALERIDAEIAGHGAVLSIGPVLAADRIDADLGAWAAELVRRTSTISFSVAVSSPEQAVRRLAVKSAAAVIAALSRVVPSGAANFRFAAAAGVPPGTPFFPVAYHDGTDSLALGLESAGFVQTVLAGATDPEDAQKRLRGALNEQLTALERLMLPLAAEQNARYLGIDPSPAPGMDSSIGAAIETLTRQPFGHPSTLQACAAITGALKTLDVRSCGYRGLMLPVLEDPVLAARAKEQRYGLQELLLYSSVCGTGLDVVPIPGDTSTESMARIIGDVATLSTRLRKPLSARLFPVPGKKSGDLVAFDDPRLTQCRVFEVDRNPGEQT